MLKTLKDITNRLVKYYEPEKIILFGSYGKRRFKKGDGDIDLFIVKDTKKRPIERQVEVERILSDRFLPLDIMVYTPEEVRFLFSIGSPFIEEIMEKGRLLYMRKATEAWIRDAQEEFDSAIILYEHGKYRGACYHSQQCVEKGLKAVILEKGKRPGRIHDIVELFNKVTKLGFDSGLSIDEAVFLNSVYRGRYPTEEGLLPHGEPSPQDAEKVLSSAKVLMERLKSLV
jgi:HEPN domain-containing protein/predicted nucleotidyltransferase